MSQNPEKKPTMSNKVFAIVTLTLSIAVFGGIAFFYKKQEAQQSSQRVSAIDPALLVKPHNHARGPETAAVTIVEFLDPECEACRAMHPIMKTLEAEYNGKIRVVTRYMPFHGNALYAASVLEEARELGKYDEALDILFETQPEWGSHHHPRPELIPEYLAKIGIDKARIAPDTVIQKHQWKVDLDHQDGMKLGVRMTPTFFVNGKVLPEIGYQPVKAAIEQALKDAEK